MNNPMKMKIRHPKGNVNNQLALIAKGMKSKLSTLDDSLDTVKYVRTRVPSFNRAVVLGGAPLGCVYAVHGPYGGGKSTFCALLLDSFVREGHIGLYIDAEHTVSKKWFVELGLNASSFFFKRPTYFEEITNEIDEMIESFDRLKDSGELEDDKALIIIIDTVNKLTPEKEYDQFRKLGAEAMEKGLARFRGLMLQTWLDHMTPIVGSRDIALVCIAQERENKNAKLWEDDFTVKGCQGLLFDAAVRFRIKHGSKTWVGPEGKKVLVGQEHQIYVFKNKVGFPHERGAFYVSNGKGEDPIGYNRAKTAFQESLRRDGIINKLGKGSWYEYGTNKWNGEKQAVAALRENPRLLDELCNELDQQIIHQKLSPPPDKEDTADPVETTEEEIEEEVTTNVGHDSSPLAG